MALTKHYLCQYSDQIRKKHKSWHDGKLKYSSLNNRLSLYSIEDGSKLLSSAFVTNNRDLEKYLSPSSFNAEEHQIFGRFTVIINELISECDEKNEFKVTTDPEQANNLSVNTNKRSPVRRKESTQGGKFHPLALKMNKPFKPPKLVNKITSQNQALNRPSIRRAHSDHIRRQRERCKIRKVNHQPIDLQD